jgi:uncharacterized protein
VNRRRWALVSFLAGSILAPAPRARAASFDCAKAATTTEKLICGDPQLSQLDGQLAQAYRRALEGAVNPDKLRAEQRAWLRTERKACGDDACLKTVYAQRLAALAATPARERALGQGPVESAPADGGSGETFKLAPVLDKAKGDAAVAAYNRRTKDGVLALASGSFTRPDADEVLLVVPSGLDLAGGGSDSALVIMQNSAKGFRIARRMGTGSTFEVRARISASGRPDRLFICNRGGHGGLYPMICGFFGQGFFGPRTKDGQSVGDSSIDVQMGNVTACGPAAAIAPGKLRLDGDRLAVDVVVDEYVLAAQGDEDESFCTKQTKKSSKTFVLTYQLGETGVRRLIPIPPRIDELVEKFDFVN